MSVALVDKFLRRKPRPPYTAPEGVRVYAVGDVHGCLDELNQLLESIDKDLAGNQVESHLVFLGDLVDRGPHSAGVIDRLLERGLPTNRWDCVMGNHEEIMLACFAGRSELSESWLRYGGVQTLESYGLNAAEIFAPAFDLQAAMRKAIPPKHIRFLQSLADYVQLGDYLFVHAGIRPNVPLERQSSRDLRWIRNGFLEVQTDHAMMVVHGHTIVPEVDFRPNRIAVDTGCYVTGKLSALVLELDQKRVLTVPN
jgi:serine/threonine protein phosphatase 1